MNKQIIIAILAVTVIGGGSYYLGSSKTNKVASDGHTDHTHDPIVATVGGTMAMNHEGTSSIATATGAKEAKTRIIVKNTSFKSGTQTISFELYGTDGDAWSDKALKVAHEKKMHFIIVSNNFASYQHVHPEYKDKLWQVDLSLDSNTGYQAYVDVDSDEIGAEVLRFPIVVGTPTATSKVTQKEISLTKDGVLVEMKAPDFVSGKENAVTFDVSQNGKAIIPENYLGAQGHVVALGDDPNTFIHGHPVDDSDVGVDFAFTFEKAGTYTLFGQFKVGGVVRTYPFTITVIEGTRAGSNTIDESKPHGH